jgi:hypothetical protein
MDSIEFSTLVALELSILAARLGLSNLEAMCRARATGHMLPFSRLLLKSYTLEAGVEGCAVGGIGQLDESVGSSPFRPSHGATYEQHGTGLVGPAGGHRVVEQAGAMSTGVPSQMSEYFEHLRELASISDGAAGCDVELWCRDGKVVSNSLFLSIVSVTVSAAQLARATAPDQSEDAVGAVQHTMPKVHGAHGGHGGESGLASSAGASSVPLARSGPSEGAVISVQLSTARNPISTQALRRLLLSLVSGLPLHAGALPAAEAPGGARQGEVTAVKRDGAGDDDEMQVAWARKSLLGLTALVRMKQGADVESEREPRRSEGGTHGAASGGDDACSGEDLLGMLRAARL